MVEEYGKSSLEIRHAGDIGRQGVLNSLLRENLLQGSVGIRNSVKRMHILTHRFTIFLRIVTIFSKNAIKIFLTGLTASVESAKLTQKARRSNFLSLSLTS